MLASYQISKALFNGKGMNGDGKDEAPRWRAAQAEEKEMTHRKSVTGSEVGEIASL